MAIGTRSAAPTVPTKRSASAGSIEGGVIEGGVIEGGLDVDVVNVDQAEVEDVEVKSVDETALGVVDALVCAVGPGVDIGGDRVSARELSVCSL